MKVLMVGNSASVKGGITTVIQTLLKYDWRRYDVDMNFIPTYIDSNFSDMLLFYVKALIQIRCFIKKEHPDIVHIHMSYKGSFFRSYVIHRICKKYAVPDIIHLHGSEFKKWYTSCNENIKRVIRKFMRESAAFIVLGSSWEKTIKEIEPETKVVVISNAVKEQKYSSHWEQPFKVLFMGVLIERKGVMDLLSVIKALKWENKLSSLKFIIAGTGPLEQELKKQVSQYDLGNAVTFCGWVDGEKREKLYRECQTLILPSYNEGLPMAILEAMSFGMPIISTNVGDVADAVHDKENGILVKPGDVNRIKETILSLAHDQQLYEKMQVESKKSIYASFAIDATLNKIYQLYNRTYEQR